MVAVYDSDGPLPDSIKFIVRTGLRWRESAFIDANYIEFGSKLGFYSCGVLTLVALLNVILLAPGDGDGRV